MKMYRSRYFFKLLLLIMAVALIPTAAVGILFSIRSSQEAREKVEQAEMLALEQTVQRVEAQLQNINKLVLQFFVSHDTMAAFRTDDLSTDFQIYNRLVNGTSDVCHDR